MDDKYRANKIIPFIEGLNILDLGGGDTTVHHLLKRKFNTIKCIDLESGIDLNYPLKYKSNQDTIINMELIEHLDSPIDFIRNCKKLLKINGKLIITTPNAGLQYIVNPSWQVFTKHNKYDGHKYLFTPPMLIYILKKEGFKILHTEYINTFWNNPLAKIICKFIPRLRSDILIVGEKI